MLKEWTNGVRTPATEKAGSVGLNCSVIQHSYCPAHMKSVYLWGIENLLTNTALGVANEHYECLPPLVKFQPLSSILGYNLNVYVSTLSTPPPESIDPRRWSLVLDNYPATTLVLDAGG